MIEEPNVGQSKKKNNSFLKLALVIGLFGGVICTFSIGFLVMLYYFDSGWSLPLAQPTKVSYYATMKPNPTSEPYNDSSPSTSGNDTSWFLGGTLHDAIVAEWREATYANRLATSADFIAATQDVDYSDMEEFKRMSIDLEICISTAVSGGDVQNEDVVFISALCLTAMYPD